MQNPQPQRLPPMPEVETRVGVRSAVSTLWTYLRRFFESDYHFKNDVTHELTPLYGEEDYTPGGALANGAQVVIDVPVPGVIFGYCVDASYDKDLQGLVMGQPYVSAADTVEIVLFNNTGGNITLTAGRFRVYAWPKILTS